MYLDRIEAGKSESHATAYARVYATKIDAGEFGAIARLYADKIVVWGYSEADADVYIKSLPLEK